MSVKGSDNMLKTKLAYLKGTSEALKTYNSEHPVIDFELVQKIYNYANNIDNLTEEQLNELEGFINENTVSIKHLANLYLDKKGKADLNNRLNRMLPIQITKPQCRIKFVKGKVETLSDAIFHHSTVKVLCKTRKHQKAA